MPHGTVRTDVYKIVQLEANDPVKMFVVRNDERPMGFVVGLPEAIAYVTSVSRPGDTLVVNVQYTL